jgi:methyl halide transferase
VSVGEPAFWQDLYERGADRWELRGPTPTLVEYLDRAGPSPGRVAVPGCGRGHDCRLLAGRGHRVWGFDWAPHAIAEARALAARDAVDVTFEQRDVFGLPAAYPGFFDGAWEYTSYCAIDPGRRLEYVRMLHAILKPGGWLLACFFPLREGSGGPPFPTSEAEIRELLAPGFAFVDTYRPETSAEGRRGLEWIVFARAVSAAGR